MLSEFPCHICGSVEVELIQGYENFRRVSSDCALWSRGGRLGVCASCGIVQAIADKEWRREVEEIYRKYSLWRQSGGAEQLIFESGGAVARSAKLLERLSQEFPLPESGRLLDIGCGNGSLLRSARRTLPGWTLVGTELEGRSLIDVDATLYTGPLEGLPGAFDIISLSHVLEHWTGPREFLRSLSGMLTARGLLIIQVPFYTENPFDLIVADHCSHFSEATLRSVVGSAGYRVLMLSTEWIPREITVVAKAGSEPSPLISPGDPTPGVKGALHWLGSLRERALRCQPPLGIFGTSIGGTWLCGELDGRAVFFVDEDPQRAGRTHLGLPTLLPRDAPHGVIIPAVAPALEEVIRRRYNIGW